jgi:protein translocase SecG subunit
MKGGQWGAPRQASTSILRLKPLPAAGMELPELLLAKRGSAPIFAPLFMDILIGILTAVEVIVCLLLILVVLMQRPRQEGLGASFGDAAASQVWGAQTTNVLQKFTVYLAVILFALTLLLAVLVSRKQNSGKTEKIFGDAKPVPAAPAAPSEEEAAKAKLMEKIQEAVKAEEKKADTAKSEPAKTPEAPKAAAPASTPAPTPAPTAAPAATPTPSPAPPTPPAAAPAPAATPAPAPAAQPK